MLPCFSRLLVLDSPPPSYLRPTDSAVPGEARRAPGGEEGRLQEAGQSQELIVPPRDAAERNRQASLSLAQPPSEGHELWLVTR